jgi:hypothetical protein
MGLAAQVASSRTPAGAIYESNPTCNKRHTSQAMSNFDQTIEQWETLE